MDGWMEVLPFGWHNFEFELKGFGFKSFRSSQVSLMYMGRLD